MHNCTLQKLSQTTETKVKRLLSQIAKAITDEENDFEQNSERKLFHS